MPQPFWFFKPCPNQPRKHSDKADLLLFGPDVVDAEVIIRRQRPEQSSKQTSRTSAAIEAENSEIFEANAA